MKINFRHLVPVPSNCLSTGMAALLTLLAFAVLFVTPQMAFAQTTWTVCQPSPYPTCDYASPEAAVSAVADGDIINVQTDTYVLGTTLEVNKSLTIQGNDSVFDANGIQAINVTGPSTNFSIGSLTIRNGQGPGGSGGGAMRISGGGTVSIVGGTFENNQADFGGAIYNSGSTLNLNVSVFSGNRATAGNGGAIFADGDGTTGLSQTTIDGNLASVAGGGLAADGGAEINVSASTISRNGAFEQLEDISSLPDNGTSNSCSGGPTGQTFIANAEGLASYEIRVRLNGITDPTDLIVPGAVRLGPNGTILSMASTILPGGSAGGSIVDLHFNLAHPVALTPGDTYSIELTINGPFSVLQSSADYPGGQRYICTGALVASDLAFRTLGGTPGDGGGIYASGLIDVNNRTSIGLNNSTLSANVGDGGAAAAGATVSTFFSTVTDNSGNGLTALPDVSFPGLVFFTTSIVAGNDGDDCSGTSFTLTSSGFNLIGDDSNCPFFSGAGIDPNSDQVGTAATPIDPQLSPLQDNGGRTFTHAIDENSPAFDAAGTSLDTYCSAAPQDQRGTTRPNGLDCDIGAFELEFAGPLQSLIDTAIPGAIIDVPDGTYTELLSIGDGKTLRGSGPGNVVIDVTGLNDSAITATGSFSLEGIRVTGGNSAGNGGGINAGVPGTDIDLLNVVFDNNTADSDGGAIYLFDGNNATINNSTFRLNHAGSFGGAISISGQLVSNSNLYDQNDASFGGAISLAGSPAETGNSTGDTFTGNIANMHGGAIHEAGTNLIVTMGLFQSNTAGNAGEGNAGRGGAIFSERSADISFSNFSLNGVANNFFEGGNEPGTGGAIYSSGSLNLADTTIETSYAGLGGGLYNDFNGNATISATTFVENNANGPGPGPGTLGSGTVGGAIGSAGTIRLTNSTLSGNTTSDGGNGAGIGLSDGTALLNNVTLAYNDSTGLGGPFYADSGNPGALIQFSNSLLSGNTGGGTNCSTLESLGYNLFQNAPCQATASDITGEPMINFLAFNGGPTQTHSLQAASPAINAGHPVPAFPQFNNSNFSLLQTQGAATLQANTLFLAGPGANQGSAFVTNPMNPGQDFSAIFQFMITPQLNGSAADGFTFTISDDPTVLGQGGGFLGIAGPGGSVVNGVSVEFDTWVNGTGEGANDPGSVDHIGIDINGSLSSVVIYSFPAHGFLSDGNVWTAWIDYDADTNTLEVRAANDGIRPDLVTVSSVVDIASLTGPNAYVGFTAGAAVPGYDSLAGQQRILNFSFANSCQPVDQRGDTRPKGSACDIGAVEGTVIPLALGAVTLSTVTPGEELANGTTYPGVVNVPIIDIPIEKLTGDSFNAPESAPLGSFPMGSFPIGSFDMQTSPLGSFPLGSFPLGSFPLGSFPIGSFPLSTMPLLTVGGWREVLDSIPALEGTPPQTVTLERLMTQYPDAVKDIELRDLSIQDSPLASLSLPGVSLGGTTVAELDQWAENAKPGSADAVCAKLAAADPNFTNCGNDDTLLSLDFKGAPVASLSLSSLPLGSFPVGSFPMGSFPIGSFPMGSFPLGSFPLGSFPLGSFPMGSFPLGSFDIGKFPMGSFDLLAAPTNSLPLGSFPIGSFPLGSFEINGKSFCEFYDEKAISSGDKTCADLGIDAGTDSLTTLVAALQTDATSRGDTTGGIGSTPLGSFPMGSFPIGSFPMGSFPLGSFDLTAPPLSELTLGHFGGCQIIDGTDDCSATASLTESSSLRDVEAEYGTLAASPLGSFPIGSFGIADLPMGSFPLGSFEINGTPLGSFPLGSFDLVSSPLGSFPLGSFAGVIDGPCPNCETLSDAAKAGVISSSATLANLAGANGLDTTTLGVVLDAMTLAMIHGPGQLKDIENTGNLTLGQMLIAMMLKTDFPWETISLDQLNAQEFSADNFIDYVVDIELTGTEHEQVNASVTLADTFLYVHGSSNLDVSTTMGANPTVLLPDPEISNNADGTQTLSFELFLGGYSDNRITFTAIPPLALDSYPATAEVVLSGGFNIPGVVADNSNSTVTVIPDPMNNISDPGLAVTAAVDELILGYIDSKDDNDYYKVAPPAAGDRVAVFMSNPAGDNDLIMYEPLSTVELKGQTNQAPALDSVPIEDDGVNYRGNLSEEPEALEDVNLADSPLASISTNRGGIDESVSAIAGNTDPFIIQVSGYNGASSRQPYTLRVKVTPGVPVPRCSARNWPGTAFPTVLPAGEWLPDTNAVFLVNGARLASSDPGGPDAADEALTAINNLINAPGITNGVVVDVADILVELGLPDYYAEWDSNPCDVDAPNAIVRAVTQYLEEQRAYSPNLSYVTIVGSDEVIPFARKPDETSISNESTFAGEFSDNAMYGALVTRHFLSDDSYGDIDPIAWLDRYLNVPELGVGRLVESAEDIKIAADNYVASSGILDPATALSAGYDFVADAAQEIDATFREYGPLLNFGVEPALIDPPGIMPKSDAWTRTDFLEATGVNTPNPVGQVSFNMHFDFDEALPSIGDATGNPKAELIHVSDLDGADLTGGIWFTVGCHSGSSVADVSVVGAPSQDWAQTFSRAGALYLAQNAYGLGDTEAVALTERLMANFARNLNGTLTIGQAHAFAKQQYFADLGLYGEYDFKALQAATLFGLPMYQYGMGETVEETPEPPIPVVTDPLSGLSSAPWSMSDTGIQSASTSKGELFSVNGEVQFVHFRPLQPIVRRDVTGPNGEIAGGAFLTALTTEDQSVTDMAFARPVIDQGENEAEIESDEVVFPTAFTNIASFNAPPPAGGPFAPRQQLNVIVGQFTSPPDGGTSGTERLFRAFDAQVFYRQAASAAQGLKVPSGPGLMAVGTSVVAVEDFKRPELDNVQATVAGNPGSQRAAFSVDATDNGSVLRVAVLYLKSASGTPKRGNWVLVDLVRGAGTNTWTGGGPVDLSGVEDGQIDYMVQALDDNGNVANSTFKGLFYVAKQLPPPPGPGVAGSIGVVVKVGGDVVNPGNWITTDPVEIEITDQDPAITYVYSVDFAPFQPLTTNGFEITKDGVHTVTVQGSDGSNPVTFVVLIDTTPPQSIITTPADGQFVVQGLEPVADFDCLDAGSGISTCVGTVADGAAVPSASTGMQSFVVTSQDDALLGPTVATHNYFVVKPLELNGPDSPVVQGETVSITASATDLAEFTETVMVDWGDGSPLEMIDLGPAGVTNVSADHLYQSADAFEITLTVDYEGQFSQTDVIEFLPVFDPDSHVSGKGRILSSVGASSPGDDHKADKADRFEFDFDVKYKKGKKKDKDEWQVDGKSKFKFDELDLDIEADSYDWLIVKADQARFKGSAKSKGKGKSKKDVDADYRFEVTVYDADIDGSGVTEDRFGIRIWSVDTSGAEQVLFDSASAPGSSATTVLDKGSIEIHEKKGKK